jgi:parallel beta-helix repeat protein
MQIIPSTFANDNTIIVEPGESIQEAINNASDGQTILIKKGEYTIEYPILVNKTVILIGESVNETIIDGQDTATAILNILEDRAEIQNLTLRNAQSSFGYGFHLRKVSYAKIQNCHIEHCTDGIYVTNSSDCEISRNFITNNYEYGAYFAGNSSHNMVFWNTIKNNTQGIFVDLNCKKNTFYQNNFVQNSLQVSGLGALANFWNSTYPVAGNYWSDHVSVDFKSGYYQNETRSDGIADEVYEQPSAVTDSYPFMGYINVFQALQLENKQHHVLVSSNASTVSNFHFDHIGNFLNFTLSGDPETGFCRVIIPRQLMWVEDGSWLVTIAEEEIEYSLVEDENCTYIGFEYNALVAKTVKIQGTDSILEFSNMILLIVTIIITALVIFTKKFLSTTHGNFKLLSKILT